MNNDLISRSALLERLRTEREEIAITSQYNIGYTNGLTMAQSIALAASAVEPERPKGRWKRVYDDSAGWVDMCTNCEEYGDEKDNFCPDCGADMRGEIDGS